MWEIFHMGNNRSCLSTENIYGANEAKLTPVDSTQGSRKITTQSGGILNYNRQVVQHTNYSFT